MKKTSEIQKTFIEISDKINSINQVIENILPQAMIRQTTSFGNSSHVVLSKEFLDKKVGVVILEDFNKKQKGGEK